MGGLADPVYALLYLASLHMPGWYAELVAEPTHIEISCNLSQLQYIFWLKLNLHFRILGLRDSNGKKTHPFLSLRSDHYIWDSVMIQVITVTPSCHKSSAAVTQQWSECGALTNAVLGVSPQTTQHGYSSVRPATLRKSPCWSAVARWEPRFKWKCGRPGRSSPCWSHWTPSSILRPWVRHCLRPLSLPVKPGDGWSTREKILILWCFLVHSLFELVDKRLYFPSQIL